MTPLKTIGRLGSVVVGLITAVSAAHAAAPVTMDGWRYADGGNDLHVFVCDRADCGPGARVICLGGRHKEELLSAKLSKEGAQAGAVAGEPTKRGTTSPNLNLDLAGGSYLIDTADDAVGKFRTYSVINNGTSHFILVSSSTDEHTSRANLARFEKALRETSK